MALMRALDTGGDAELRCYGKIASNVFAALAFALACGVPGGLVIQSGQRDAGSDAAMIEGSPITTPRVYNIKNGCDMKL